MDNTLNLILLDKKLKKFIIKLRYARKPISESDRLKTARRREEAERERQHFAQKGADTSAAKQREEDYSAAKYAAKRAKDAEMIPIAKPYLDPKFQPEQKPQFLGSEGTSHPSLGDFKDAKGQVNPKIPIPPVKP